MGTRAVAKSLYALFGVVYLAAGVGVLLAGTGLLPGFAAALIADVSHGDANTLHVMQEFGSVLVFVGLTTFWFVRHYEHSRAFHWAMTAFWGLFALIHWFDIRGPLRSLAGPAVNTVPFVLFASVGLLRAWSDGRRARI